MKKLTSNIGLKLVALLAAIVLWCVIINVDDPVNTRTFNNIEVTMTNESVITNAGQIYQVLNSTNLVSVRVTATRNVLSKIKKEDIVAVADFRNLQLDSMVPITVTIPAYEGKYSQISSNPGNVMIQVEHLGSTTLPVSVTLGGSPRKGYFVQSTEVYPDNLTVTGPASIIKKISAIKVMADVSGLSTNADIDSRVHFYDANDSEIESNLIKIDQGIDMVQVTVFVVPAKKVPIEIKYSGKVKTGYEVSKVTCEPVEISIVGKSDDIAAVDSIIIPDDVLNVSGASDDVSVVIDIIDYLPAGISLAEDQSDKVMITAVINKFGTRTVDYPVGSIKIDNLPENFTVSFGDTSKVVLMFSGASQSLSELNIANINVSIDLSGINSPGTFDARLVVSAENGCELAEQAKIEVIVEETKDSDKKLQ